MLLVVAKSAGTGRPHLLQGGMKRRVNQIRARVDAIFFNV